MSAVKSTESAVKATAISVHQVLVDLVKLENPTVAAAVAAFVLNLIPGTGISTSALVAAVAGIGVVASVIEKFITKSPSTPPTPPTA